MQRLAFQSPHAHEYIIKQAEQRQQIHADTRCFPQALLLSRFNPLRNDAACIADTLLQSRIAGDVLGNAVNCDNN
jgi:hypothetical protein